MPLDLNPLNDHSRLLIEATLKPVQGARFQKWSVKTGQAFRCRVAVVYAAFVSGFRL